MHSELVDLAISRIENSLPEEVSRLTTLQKDQHSQLGLLRQELQRLQVSVVVKN
jgi:hypothetical protein